MENVRVEARSGPTRCPYCHDELLAGQRTVACTGCEARHHAACFKTNQRCATCGGKTAGAPEGPSELDAPRRGHGALSLERKVALLVTNVAALAALLHDLGTTQVDPGFWSFVLGGFVASAVSGVAARSYLATLLAPLLLAVVFALHEGMRVSPLDPVIAAVFFAIVIGMQAAVGAALTYFERTYN